MISSVMASIKAKDAAPIEMVRESSDATNLKEEMS